MPALSNTTIKKQKAKHEEQTKVVFTESIITYLLRKLYQGTQKIMQKNTRRGKNQKTYQKTKKNLIFPPATSIIEVISWHLVMNISYFLRCNILTGLHTGVVFN